MIEGFTQPRSCRASTLRRAKLGIAEGGTASLPPVPVPVPMAPVRIQADGGVLLILVLRGGAEFGSIAPARPTTQRTREPMSLHEQTEQTDPYHQLQFPQLHHRILGSVLPAREISALPRRDIHPRARKRIPSWTPMRLRVQFPNRDPAFSGTPRALIQ